jgi:NAD(P)-dependent dehydrogenase (short-subunit alcohol dehydrogenase family)
MQLDLTDKIAFVSAGASGIGSVIAQTLMAQGASVLVSDIDSDRLSQFLADHPDARGTTADAGSWSDTQNVFSQIQSTFGRLDILVNNAGIAGPTAAVDEIEPDDWERTIAVDINGAFYAMKLATPMLRAAGGGSVVNIASNAAFFGFPLRSPYAASKWALIGLTKTWAMELGADRIRVNALCPGSVSGARIDSVIERDAASRGVTVDRIREIYTRQSSLKQFTEPEDVASMVAFLCSNAGSRISGQAIGIDGHTEGLGNPFDE